MGWMTIASARLSQMPMEQEVLPSSSQVIGGLARTLSSSDCGAEAAFESLVRKQVEKLRNPGMQCSDLVFSELQRMVRIHNREKWD